MRTRDFDPWKREPIIEKEELLYIGTNEDKKECVLLKSKFSFQEMWEIIEYLTSHEKDGPLFKLGKDVFSYDSDRDYGVISLEELLQKEGINAGYEFKFDAQPHLIEWEKNGQKQQFKITRLIAPLIDNLSEKETERIVKYIDGEKAFMRENPWLFNKRSIYEEIFQDKDEFKSAEMTKIYWYLFQTEGDIVFKHFGNSVLPYFFRGTALKRITLPPGVKSISYLAFAECTNLEDIYIPDGVKKIGACAFRNCSSLKHVRFPKNIDPFLSWPFNEEWLFYECNPDVVIELFKGSKMDKYLKKYYPNLTRKYITK